MSRSARAALVALLVTLPVLPVATWGQSTASQDWCRDADRWSDRDEVFCEVRTLTASGQTRLEASTANGSLTVTGSARRDVEVQARVVARARTEAEARTLAREVVVTLEDGRLRATGPRPSGDPRPSGWDVSYRIQVPARHDLDLQASNGAIAITGVSGVIDARTANGAIRLTDLGGRVNARTSNGSTHVTASGSRWDGEGLTVVTTNGAARVDVPDHYNARLVLGTSNGALNVDFPVTVQGSIGGHLNRRLETTLGTGGPVLDVRTTNGSVRLARR